MLVFVSDMHLTDQTLAPSVCPEALEQLTKEVRQIAKKVKKVKLIFLGDIFDVLRSSHWLVKISGDSFLYTPVSIRPWHAVDAPLERVVSTILADIKKSYLYFFKELSGIENVESIWVSGNLPTEYPYLLLDFSGKHKKRKDLKEKKHYWKKD